MTELNLNPSSGQMNDVREKLEKPTSRWMRVTIAFVLSLLFPGLGQLYNRQPRKGLCMAVALILIVFLEGTLHSFETFKGFVIHLLLWGGGAVFILIDACRTAWTGGREERSFRSTRIMFSILGVLIVLLASLPASDWFRSKFLYIKAFRVPSASMCPTVCEGERMIADMRAVYPGFPKRGDIVLLQFKQEQALFTKRVIAVGGDTVAPGRGDAILVNGKPISSVEICGKPQMGKYPQDAREIFDEVKVPANSLFVIGDNLHNSYDSRIPGFGFVRPDQVRGKPLFLYWSTGTSRIGCRLH